MDNQLMSRQDFWREHAALKDNPQKRLELHFRYHAQIVRLAGIKVPEHMLALCREAVAKGDGWALNKVPLKLWDNLAEQHKSEIQRAARKIGDGWSLGVGVCVMKEAARQQLAAEGIIPN